MKKILGLAIAGILLLAAVAGGTMAWFNDTETSDSNQIVAGTLDLDWDSADDTAAYVFQIATANGYPGNSGSEYKLIKNSGSIAGELDIAFADLLNTESAAGKESTNDSAPGVSDTATGGSTTTVVKNAAGWTVNGYRGYTATVTGKGARTIISNTADTLTVSAATPFTGAVVNTDPFTITGGEIGANATVRIWIDIGKDSAFTDTTDILLKQDGSVSTAVADYTAYAPLAGASKQAINNYAAASWAAGVASMAATDEYRFYIDWAVPTATANSSQGDTVSFSIDFTLQQAAEDV